MLVEFGEGRRKKSREEERRIAEEKGI